MTDDHDMRLTPKTTTISAQQIQKNRQVQKHTSKTLGLDHINRHRQEEVNYKIKLLAHEGEVKFKILTVNEPVQEGRWTSRL